MKEQHLEVKVALQIQTPPEEVYEALVDPAKMSNYFISKGSGKMVEGHRIRWKFPEFDLEFPIHVGKMEPAKYISFTWDVDGFTLLVEMQLDAAENNSTVVTVTEKSRDFNVEAVKWLQGNTAGWANFLACLKAWMEYGINLRKGAFDYMKGQMP